MRVVLVRRFPNAPLPELSISCEGFACFRDVQQQDVPKLSLVMPA